MLLMARVALSPRLELLMSHRSLVSPPRKRVSSKSRPIRTRRIERLPSPTRFRCFYLRARDSSTRTRLSSLYKIQDQVRAARRSASDAIAHARLRLTHRLRNRTRPPLLRLLSSQRSSSNPRPRRVQHLGGAYQARATPRESRDCRCWRYNKSKSDNTARSKPASERHHSSRVPRKARAQPLLYLLRLQPGRLHAPDGEAARYPRVRRRHVFRCETYNRIKREQQLQPINRLKSPLYQLEHHQRSQKPQQFHKQFHKQFHAQ